MTIAQPSAMFERPIAENGDKTILPASASSVGRASLWEGFPKITETPLAAGGYPPHRLDMNGALYMLSSYAHWYQSGGMWEYNQTLDYATPCVVYHNGEFWLCVDDNGVGTSAGIQIPANGSLYWRRAWQKVPVGEVIFFARKTPPDGFLECNGADLNRVVFSDLFNAIGTDFGFGSASTFKLPDLRGRFIRPWDNGAGIDNGRIFGSLQTDAIRNITGSFEIRKSYPGAVSSTILSPSGAISVATGADPSSGTYSIGSGGPVASPDKVNFKAADAVPTASENRPVNIALLAAIRYI